MAHAIRKRGIKKVDACFNALVDHARGLTPPAELAYQRAAELSPSYPAPHFFLGLALARSGDRENALKVLRRAVELGANLIDTADAYGPETDELLIAKALYPYPKGLVIATKGGNTRPSPNQ